MNHVRPPQGVQCVSSFSCGNFGDSTKMATKKVNPADFNIPTERYWSMMIEGCKHHGVAQSWIDWLERHSRWLQKTAKMFLRLRRPSNRAVCGPAEAGRAPAACQESLASSRRRARFHHYHHHRDGQAAADLADVGQVRLPGP